VQLASGRLAHLVFTDRDAGDLRIGAPRAERDARRSALAPGAWTALRQVHGASVVEVHAPGQHHGVEADAAVTAISNAPLAVQTADCAPIALLAHGGAVGVVHAGWRGLMAGVVAEAANRLAGLAEGPYLAVLGPCIHPECYAFSEPDLAVLVDRFGPGVRGETSDGAPALDVPAAVAASVAELAIELDIELDTSRTACTACGGRWFSHRARGERARQALVVWIEDPP
jgi:polyphenol oxidase